jgi:predicted RNase H-like HicB family nuclease
MAQELAKVLNQECLHVNIWEEDGVFIGECTDIPGCFTQGATRNEALANLMDAISGCLDVIAADAGVARAPLAVRDEAVSSFDLPTKIFSPSR